MMLIYINTFILLLGYEFNIALLLAKEQEDKNKARKNKENKIIFLETETPANG
jgi:uncharacterized BrkB/YihY/UPF0761 family membrane protein